MNDGSLKGHLLIAGSKLGDSNFTRSVVLMLEHDDEGALGVVLNRPSNTSIGDLWEHVCDEPCDCQQPVDLGGPVSGPLIALHADSALSESDILPGVFMATQKEMLEQLVHQSETSFRVFSGYAGWGAGQLEVELEEEAWLTRAAEGRIVFSQNQDLWQAVGREITDDVLHAAMKIDHVPDDPSLN